VVRGGKSGFPIIVKGAVGIFSEHIIRFTDEYVRVEQGIYVYGGALFEVASD